MGEEICFSNLLLGFGGMNSLPVHRFTFFLGRVSTRILVQNLVWILKLPQKHHLCMTAKLLFLRDDYEEGSLITLSC